MKLEGLTLEQVEHIRELFNKYEPVTILGVPVAIYNLVYQREAHWNDLWSVEIAAYAVPPVSQETEEEKQLKHINKLHEQDIEHKNRLIANNNSKLEALRKKREDV